MGLRKVNLSLAPLDVFKPDLVLEIDAANGSRRYLDFTELAMKQLCSLF